MSFYTFASTNTMQEASVNECIKKDKVKKKIAIRVFETRGINIPSKKQETE